MNYIELEVWIEARRLANLVYTSTKEFPKDEIYGLTSQIRRSVFSVPSNIAEGCGRQYSKESIQFLYISRGSLYELETQLYLALDQEYIMKTNFDELLKQVEICKKLINGFINYYKKLNHEN